MKLNWVFLGFLVSFRITGLQNGRDQVVVPNFRAKWPKWLKRTSKAQRSVSGMGVTCFPVQKQVNGSLRVLFGLGNRESSCCDCYLVFSKGHFVL